MVEQLTNGTHWEIMVDRELHWKVWSSELVADCKVFTVHKNVSSPPEGDDKHDFYVLKPNNWVNVIPVTGDSEVILIEQYRHGIDHVTLEIPGGTIDASETSSSEAGRRELLEETGYEAEEMIFLGRNHPNPAIQDNYCDTYLATNCKKVSEPRFDGTEDIELQIVTLEDIPELIESGTITHALVIVAFYYLGLFLPKSNVY
jgi:8-oxo-dGTP pyrophosphatase MutT (NUDIX family)